MVRIKDFLIKFFLVTSSLFFMAGRDPYASQEIFIQYSAFVALGLSFLLVPERRVNNWFLGLIFIYCIAQTMLFHFNPVNRMSLLNMFLGIYLVKFFAEYVIFDTKKIGITFIWLACLNILWVGLQTFNIDPIFTNVNIDKMPQADTVGFFGSKFAMGCWASLALPFVYAVSPICSVVLLPLLYWSKSSISMLSAIVVFMFLMWNTSKRWFYSLLALLGVGCYWFIFKYDMPNGDFQKRFQVWLAAINLLKNNLFLGQGLGSWKEAMVMTSQQTSPELKYWSWMHNDLLQFAYEAGVIGFIGLYLYLKNSFKKCMSSIKKDLDSKVMFGSLISLLIISMFHFPFHIGRLAGISIFILAFVEAKTTDHRG